MKKIINKYLRPFWFSKNCDTIKVPYVYNFLIICIIVSLSVQFMIMAWIGFNAGVLGVVSGTIAIFAGLYVGIINFYEKAKQNKKSATYGSGKKNEI